MAAYNDSSADSITRTIDNINLDSKETEKPFEVFGDDESVEADYSQNTLPWRPWRMHKTGFAAIIAQNYRGTGTDDDPFLVIWLSDDAENPKTYTNVMRWSVTLLVSWMTLSVALASSAYSEAVEQLIIQFHCSEEVAIMGLSLMVLGYALGPLVWGSMSEVYGRRLVLCISYILYTLFTAVTCASQNMASVIIFRFLSGIFGSSALVIPGGQIADMFPIETRGLGIGAFLAAPFLGPALGPLIGGYLGDAAGWRWVFGLLAIYAAIMTLIGIIFMPETYPPLLLRERAARLSEATGRKYLSLIDAENPLALKQLVQTALRRPWILLVREPIVLVTTVSRILGCFPYHAPLID
jgi:multidrug resistance protein